MYTITLLVLCVAFVSAWGPEGHAITARLASNRLPSHVYYKVKQMLGGREMWNVSSYPDDYDHTPQGEWSFSLHFANLRYGLKQFTDSECLNTDCVPRAINNYTEILRRGDSIPCDFKSPAEPCALDFLIHFVGDVHQPLHVSYLKDHGGNDVNVTFYETATNLHDVWDTRMITRWNSDLYSATRELESMIDEDPSLVARFLESKSTQTWANESFQYVLTNCYNWTHTRNGVPDLYTDYYDNNLPVVKRRLIGGGVRLAALLTELFG